MATKAISGFIPNPGADPAEAEAAIKRFYKTIADAGFDMKPTATGDPSRLPGMSAFDTMESWQEARVAITNPVLRELEDCEAQIKVRRLNIDVLYDALVKEKGVAAANKWKLKQQMQLNHLVKVEYPRRQKAWEDYQIHAEEERLAKMAESHKTGRVLAVGDRINPFTQKFETPVIPPYIEEEAAGTEGAEAPPPPALEDDDDSSVRVVTHTLDTLDLQPDLPNELLASGPPPPVEEPPSELLHTVD